MQHDAFINDEVTRLCRLNDTTLSSPLAPEKWSIKEIIGHMYYWDCYLCEHVLPYIEESVSLPEFPNHDEFNQKAMEKIQRRSPKEVLQQFLRQRRKLITAFSKHPDPLVFTIREGLEDVPYTIEQLRYDFLEHDEHHLLQIRQFLSDRSVDSPKS
ncbi:DinB family protein [Geomicrobium sp. JCM 19039]|uniref:DinB family protein n=1 Tax=Geomicrobium sp. JCM 19039 TaxID=1460636 RepID=UPI00045F3A07|nr:DinB family protein [Geomicrobium sp. JCM 19039]GAK13018.1 hypothetical protein JCM19039_2831 [Geomicrobium sp. JCM 19039]